MAEINSILDIDTISREYAKACGGSEIEQMNRYVATQQTLNNAFEQGGADKADRIAKALLSGRLQHLGIGEA